MRYFTSYLNKDYSVTRITPNTAYMSSLVEEMNFNQENECSILQTKYILWHP